MRRGESNSRDWLTEDEVIDQVADRLRGCERVRRR
jgi:hypothetical protein